MAGGVGHTGGLTKPRPWRRRCRVGYSNTGGPPLPQKRAPLQKKAQLPALSVGIREEGSQHPDNKTSCHILVEPHNVRPSKQSRRTIWRIVNKTRGSLCTQPRRKPRARRSVQAAETRTPIPLGRTWASRADHQEVSRDTPSE